MTVLLARAHLVGVDSACTADPAARLSHRGTKRQESVPKPQTNGGKGFVLQLNFGASFLAVWPETGSLAPMMDQLWKPIFHVSLNISKNVSFLVYILYTVQ